MRREGRQHGMVQWFLVWPEPKPGEKMVNLFDTRPTTGHRTRVQRQPTNHSKYTSRCRRPRCRGCHANPVSKARDKAKGTRKDRSRDAAMNHLLSVTRDYYDDYDCDYDYDDGGSQVVGCFEGKLLGCDDVNGSNKDENNVMEVGDEGDDMGFCKVRFVWDLEDEGDWCGVGEN